MPLQFRQVVDRLRTKTGERRARAWQRGWLAVTSSASAVALIDRLDKKDDDFGSLLS
jgi:hypothetical protein